MNSDASTLLLAATLLLPLLAALAPIRVAGRMIAGAALLGAVITVDALTGSTVEAGAFAVTGLTGLFVLLVTGMGATVLSYANRALRDEPYQRRFAALGSLLVAAGVILATATDLAVLVAAWVATSALTVALVQTGPAQARTDRSIRARRTFWLSDAAVVAAGVIIVGATGQSALGSLGGSDIGAWGPLAAVLLVVGAATRSATVPFHRWLPDSLGAPTPSSALLHAGVVNGGAMLLIKAAPISTDLRAGAIAALVLGAVSCVFAEAVMMTRADVKGRLAWSTIAQMSFTLILCGLGLPLAAGLHLVAHGLYKGNLFLGSGSGVRAIVRGHLAPPPVSRLDVRALGVAAVAATTGAAVLAVQVSGAELTANLAIPAFLATVTGAAAAVGWMRRAHGFAPRAAGLAGAAAAVWVFVALTATLKVRIGETTALSDGVLHPALIIPVLVALVGVAFARNRARPAGSFQDRLWKAIRQAGQPTPPRSRLLPGGTTATNPSTKPLAIPALSGSLTRS